MDSKVKVTANTADDLFEGIVEAYLQLNPKTTLADLNKSFAKMPAKSAAIPQMFIPAAHKLSDESNIAILGGWAAKDAPAISAAAQPLGIEAEIPQKALKLPKTGKQYNIEYLGAFAGAAAADGPIVDLSYSSTMSDVKIQKKFNETYGGWIHFKSKGGCYYCNNSDKKFADFITGSIKKGNIVANGNMTVAELENKYKELGITAIVAKGNKFLVKEKNTKLADINKQETEVIVEFNYSKDTRLNRLRDLFRVTTGAGLYFNGIIPDDSSLQRIYGTVKEGSFSINEKTTVAEVEKLFADHGMNVKVMDNKEYFHLDKNVTMAEAGSITIKNKADFYYNKETLIRYFQDRLSYSTGAGLFFFDKNGIIADDSSLQRIYGTVKEGTISINEKTTVAEVEKLFADHGMNVKVMDKGWKAHLDKNVTMAEAGSITIKNKAEFYFNKDTKLSYFTNIFHDVTGGYLRIFDKKGLRADDKLCIHNITGEVKEGTFSITEKMTVAEVIKLFKDKLGLDVKILDKGDAGYLDNKVTMDNAGTLKPTRLELDLTNKSYWSQVSDPFYSAFHFRMYVCDKDKKKEYCYYDPYLAGAELTKPGHLTVTGDMTPEQVEKLMKDTFGLYVLFKDNSFYSKLLPPEYCKKTLTSLYDIKL